MMMASYMKRTFVILFKTKIYKKLICIPVRVEGDLALHSRPSHLLLYDVTRALPENYSSIFVSRYMLSPEILLYV